MDNDRSWPKPLPRIGKDITVSFGEPVNNEKVFGPFRERWREMKENARQKRLQRSPEDTGHNAESDALGVLTDDDLKFSPEVEQLRMDVTLAVRNEVLKVRRASGLPDEDPKRGLAETFRAEKPAPREGVQQDSSSLKDT